MKAGPDAGSPEGRTMFVRVGVGQSGWLVREGGLAQEEKNGFDELNMMRTKGKRIHYQIFGGDGGIEIEKREREMIK